METKGCIYLANGELSPLRHWRNVAEAAVLEASFAKFWGEAMYGWLILDTQPFQYRGEPYRKAFARKLMEEAAVASLERISAQARQSSCRWEA
jgi:hypothetical protein